jgi:hypothetical protein
MEDLADVVHWALDALDHPDRGGLGHLPLWVQIPGTLNPLDPHLPLRTRTQWPLGRRDSGWAPGIITRHGVQELGRSLGAGTQHPPWLLPLPWVLDPGTMNRLRWTPLALGIAVALATLRPAPCSQL